MALTSYLPDWSRLSRLQQVVIAGAGLALAFHVAFMVLVVGFMVAIAPEGKGLFVLKWMGPNALMYLVPSLVGAFLIVLLTVKIGGPDQPLKPLRVISVSYFLVPELSWLSVIGVGFYSIFVDPTVASRDYVQVFTLMSIGTMLLGIIVGFAVWGIMAAVSKE